MPRVVASCARTGVTDGPPPAAPTAIATRNATARAAGALRRVLIGVPLKDISIFCQIGVKLVTRRKAVNAAGDHDWVMKEPSANNPPNTATAGRFGKARQAENDA